MSAYKIAEGIFAVGVQNPNLRVFDIIMETKFGTTYNSYIVKGSEKTALIETVHFDFFDDFLENISTVCDVKDIDYVILNHCEPDHSGSLAKLLELCPNIQVVTSVPGAKYLKAIANRDFSCIVAKDGLEIDLGGKVLKFITAPFLHWPDSMFTYLEGDRVLFSCDFLGAHYCEPKVLDTSLKYPEDYEYSFKNYYDAIFSPFKPFVLAGLDKIDKLDIDFVCTSHGPVLTQSIERSKKLYRQWSSKSGQDDLAVIAYVSAYGCTKALACEADKVLIENGYKTEMFDIINSDFSQVVEKIHQAKVVMFGSPTINRDALKPVWDVLSSLDAISNKGKHCGVFGSYGWSGEAVPLIVQRLRSLSFNVAGDGFKANFIPSEKELEGMREYTRQLAYALK
ncbi:MAG: FprA family A-type flavoprotein [Eubacteriales bacterium]|nr:FprA family A-type flavoprotein [Eubacteriales bacterium]